MGWQLGRTGVKGCTSCSLLQYMQCSVGEKLELCRGYYSMGGWSFVLCRGNVEVDRPGKAHGGVIAVEVDLVLDGIALQ